MVIFAARPLTNIGGTAVDEAEGSRTFAEIAGSRRLMETPTRARLQDLPDDDARASAIGRRRSAYDRKFRMIA